MNSPTLASITFDCTDALVTARFWADVLRRPLPDDATADYVQLAGEPAWSFYAVPEPKRTKNRMHVDLDVADLPGEVERLLTLGATPARRLRRARLPVDHDGRSGGQRVRPGRGVNA